MPTFVHPHHCMHKPPVLRKICARLTSHILTIISSDQYLPSLHKTMSSRRSSARLASRETAGTSDAAPSARPAALNGSSEQVSSRRRPAKRKPTGEGSATPNGTSTEQAIDDPSSAVPKPPETPDKKRQRTSKPRSSNLVQQPPPTPTPSNVNLLASSNPPSTPDNTTTPTKRRRRAEPHATNAPLQTPGGHRLLAYPSQVLESSQDAQAFDQSNGVITTDNLLDKACEHLMNVDPQLKAVIDKHHCRLFSPQGLAESVEPFTALASGIIGQQVNASDL